MRIRDYVIFQSGRFTQFIHFHTQITQRVLRQVKLHSVIVRSNFHTLHSLRYLSVFSAEIQHSAILDKRR